MSILTRIWDTFMDWAWGCPTTPLRGRPYVLVLIEVQHVDGVQPAYARIYEPKPDETSFEVTVYPDGKPCDRHGSCDMCGFYDYETGRHITWGMGRYDLDEYPHVTKGSMMVIHANRELL